MNNNTEKRKVTLTFYRKELLYDIKNIAWVASDVIGNEERLHYKHQLSDIGEEGNIDQVTRIMSLAIGECKVVLSRYIDDTISDNDVLDNSLTEVSQFNFIMSVPATMKKPVLEHIRNLIHQYVVYSVLVNWMGVIGPEDGNPKSIENWIAMSNDAMDGLKSNSFIRTGNYRIKQTPF